MVESAERAEEAMRPARDLVLVHSSDLHIDVHAVPGAEGSNNLHCVLSVARRVGADLILLAGDTFDSHRQPAAFIADVFAIIGKQPIPVVMLPGNHDPVVPEAVYRHLPEDGGNLHILGVTHDEAVVFAELDLEVWGRAHRDYCDMDPFAQTRSRSTRWQIAMGHGHYHPVPDRSTQLRPSWLISDKELAATQADYVALGHWNRAVDVGSATIHAHYSGSPDCAGTVNVVRLNSDGKVEVSREPVDSSLD